MPFSHLNLIIRYVLRFDAVHRFGFFFFFFTSIFTFSFFFYPVEKRQRPLYTCGTYSKRCQDWKTARGRLFDYHRVNPNGSWRQPFSFFFFFTLFQDKGLPFFFFSLFSHIVLSFKDFNTSLLAAVQQRDESFQTN